MMSLKALFKHISENIESMYAREKAHLDQWDNSLTDWNR